MISVEKFIPNAKTLMLIAENEIKQLLAQILAREPKNVLQHGFSITRDVQGNAITTMKQALRERELQIQFRDGVITVNTKSSKTET